MTFKIVCPETGIFPTKPNALICQNLLPKQHAQLEMLQKNTRTENLGFIKIVTKKNFNTKIDTKKGPSWHFIVLHKTFQHWLSIHLTPRSLDPGPSNTTLTFFFKEILQRFAWVFYVERIFFLLEHNGIGLTVLFLFFYFFHHGVLH